MRKPQYPVGIWLVPGSSVGRQAPWPRSVEILPRPAEMDPMLCSSLLFRSQAFHVVGRRAPWTPTTFLVAEHRNLTMGLFQGRTNRNRLCKYHAIKIAKAKGSKSPTMAERQAPAWRFDRRHWRAGICKAPGPMQLRPGSDTTPTVAIQPLFRRSNQLASRRQKGDLIIPCNRRDGLSHRCNWRSARLFSRATTVW